MMGQHDGQKEFFSYQVDLDRRVRADHPLRTIRARIDFRFVRDEVAHCYGHKGNVSTDPEVILKLKFLLFLDDVKRERELMRMLPERLSYLWFPEFEVDRLFGAERDSAAGQALARSGREDIVSGRMSKCARQPALFFGPPVMAPGGGLR